ncbi:DUF3618 domain-containing protein [Micromonospora olivasterospora]|uniref:Uncharacterized protein DUF3618 n=1 Tax=Micromonospora olivasterospora TaxID=1880 RepID=A0A562IEH6_MICOL|nr:DUF3618 domain-containing protein [Micromonospora olivasterospora]TWH69411.1 uncharacterized protein DUF3618 [Micromonospora olivasterospora]
MTGNGTGDTEALREEIRRTRVELGETMEALAAKADVKARLRNSTEQAKERMRGQAAQTLARVRGQAVHGAETVRGQARSGRASLRRGGPAPWAALAAGAVATMIVLLVVRGRRR